MLENLIYLFSGAGILILGYFVGYNRINPRRKTKQEVVPSKSPRYKVPEFRNQIDLVESNVERSPLKRAGKLDKE